MAEEMNDINVPSGDEVNPDEPRAEEGENFAELFEKSASSPGRLSPGEKVKTTVVGLRGDMVYVDLGGKSEGVIAAEEFVDEEGNLRVGVGDEVEAYFVTVQNGARKLTTMVKGYSTLSLAAIRDAYEAGLSVSGRVSRAVKGGFEVMVGKVRAFCPFSHIDVRGARDESAYVGEEFPFKVLEFREEGANVILSRRAILEEEKERQREELKASLSVGQEIAARVSSLQKFGAFADIGGIEGLIPMSEMAWGNVGKAGDLLSLGQEITVKVIGIDWERNRLTLSLKSMQEDPWKMVAVKYPVDSRISGTIVRLTPFGAFVNVEPGVDGLVHISKLGAGRRITHPKEVVEVGQVVEATVAGVDPEAKKLSLSMEPVVEKVPVVLPEVGDVLDGTVVRVMPYGVLVRLQEHLTGLIPNAEVGTPRGTNHSKMFPEGTPLQVIVIDVDEERGRITLSRSKVDEKIEAEEIQRYKERVKEEEKTSASLGSLGEILKAKLGDLK